MEALVHLLTSVATLHYSRSVFFSLTVFNHSRDANAPGFALDGYSLLSLVSCHSGKV